jgi:HAD superfamily hydrolase (TIGR01509 family)
VNKYSAYIFDLDGTLVQSEKLKGKAISEACSYFGKKVSIETYKDIMGESWEVVTSYFFKKAKINPNKNEFDRVFKKIYEKLIQVELDLSPNVKKILKKLSQNNKKLAIVSSASLWMLEQILQKFDLSKYFDVIITKENVKNHKPNPEAYFLALNKLSLSSSKVLVFEDSFAGIKAAKAAGCDVIAFKHEFNMKHDFSLAKNVISDFSEIDY